jgi:hypothetical protein
MKTPVFMKRFVDYNVEVRVEAHGSASSRAHGATEQRHLTKETPCSST